METILVTGGTGNIGRAFVAELAHDARAPVVRVATRDPRSSAAQLLRAMNPATVQPVALDTDDPASVRAAFEGITGLFVVAPFVRDIAAWHAPIAQGAAECGSCRYIVKASVTGAHAPDAGVLPAQYSLPVRHWAGEEALRKTGVPTAAIRPTMYMQHFLDGPALYRAGDDRFQLPIGAARVAFLDCRDIATFAAALLLAPAPVRAEHAGAAHELTGPDSLTAGEIATILGLAAGRPVSHVDGEAAFCARAAEIGASDAVKFIYREAAEGWFAAVEHAAFTRVTGRRPTSFAEFALDHAEHFRPATTGPRRG